MNYNYYKGEIKSSIIDTTFTCYILADNPIEAENKLLSYYDKHLFGEFGECPDTAIYVISNTEYYGMKKLNYGLFI